MNATEIKTVLSEHAKWLNRTKGNRADLSGTYLGGAYLNGADLRHANLSGAGLSRANLSGANLSGANINYANLNGADLSGAQLPVVLVVPGLDQKMREACEIPGSLNMCTWHTCETTHCRAGWAVVLAGEAGRALEDQISTPTAAALIYASTYLDRKIPDFYTNNGDAMQDIRRCAALTST
mgnify:CR=1 FL=1